MGIRNAHCLISNQAKLQHRLVIFQKRELPEQLQGQRPALACSEALEFPPVYDSPDDPKKLPTSISNLMGFTVGFSIDLSGIGCLNGGPVLGGAGCFEGDFYAPLVMLALSSVTVLFKRYLSPEDKKNDNAPENRAG